MLAGSLIVWKTSRFGFISYNYLGSGYELPWFRFHIVKLCLVPVSYRRTTLVPVSYRKTMLVLVSYRRTTLVPVSYHRTTLGSGSTKKVKLGSSFGSGS